jgi:hypothetical protein
VGQQDAAFRHSFFVQGGSIIVSTEYRVPALARDTASL